MKSALIATLFNEADSVIQWWECIFAQTRVPDEIAIVDGGSTDGTWEKLQELQSRSPVPIQLEQHRCNIAEGRNRAIRMTSATIIASSDGGSFPDPSWFEELTRPLLEDPTVDIVGGKSEATLETEFQKFLRFFEPAFDTPQAENAAYSSSRNIAFRREVWAAVGGYPEWLTLAAEDALFNYQIHYLGRKFIANPKAVVRWSERPDAEAYFRLLYRNGYGAGEAQLYTPYFRQRLIVALCPLLLLFSQHRFQHLGFRYRKNFSSAMGWVMGKLKGHQPPPGWKREDGVLLSPETQSNPKAQG